jgi:hypothetical protein
MKRCPKCNRSFPDDNQKFCTIDGGLLVTADKPFDPNATIQSSANLGLPVEPPPNQSASGRPPDFGETVATPSSAPTEILSGMTGPTGSVTSSNLPPPVTPPQTPPTAPISIPPAAPAAPAPPPVQARPLPQTQSSLPPVAVAPPKKKSKLPLILGLLLLLFVLGAGAAVAAFFLVIKPRLGQLNSERTVVVKPNQNENVNANVNTNTEEAKTEGEKTEGEFVAPPNTTKFTNSQANVDGKLAEHYLDFSFYYPDAWAVDPKAGIAGATNFAKVERRLPPDFTQENFAVGWYTSKGTFAADESTFPQLVQVLGTNLATNFPGYQKVSEGPTKVNSLDGYEFRFVSVSKGSEKGDIQVWGRVIFLPTGVSGDQTGATLVMLATSLAPELSGVNDVGEKGQMPVILDSFRFGK